jgi:isoquinoline 1-oxidoreductase alpha subunit
MDGSTRSMRDSTAPLLWVLQGVLGLTGITYGCGMGMGGACTVMVDGQAEHSRVYELAAING